MPTLTAKQKSDLALIFLRASTPASDLTPSLRAQLATAAQGANADAAVVDAAAAQADATAAAAAAAAAQGTASTALSNAATAQADAATAIADAASAQNTADQALAAATLGFGHWELQAAAGADGGSLGASYVTRLLTTTLHNSISGASLSSGQVVLPAGTFFVKAWAAGEGVGFGTLQILKASDASVLLQGSPVTLPVGTGGVFPVSGIITLAVSDALELMHVVGSPPSASTDGGRNLETLTAAGVPEVYAAISIWRLS